VPEPRTVVQLVVRDALVELASDALWQAEPSAVLEVPLGDGRVRLTADVARPEALDTAWGAVELAVDDDGYLDAWRTWAAPIRAGRHVVLHPAWIPIDPAEPEDPEDPEALVVVLDPGRAFGSGSHESTRLAVAALEEVVRGGEAVLDVGCGSGVLAVLACRLGAAQAQAIDTEPEAVEATLANALANGVADRIQASTTGLSAVEGPFDLVVANIGGSTLFDLAPDLARRVRPGGLVVLSGILAERAGALAAVFADVAGLLERDRLEEAGWAALVLASPTDGAS
jgi:ribosomal protein L11 methyltransferase